MSGQRTDIGILSGEQIELAARRPQSRERKARLGFIGAGWWATTNHIPLLRAREDVEFVSACTLDEDLNARLMRDFGFHHVTTDFRELLQQDLDGVVVSSPHGFHAEHAHAALAAGCHVLVEKPLTTSAAQARELVSLAQEKQLHILVPYGWHYRPLSLRAKELMTAGAVGTVEYVMCHMSTPLKALLTGRQFNPPGSYVQPEASTWTDPRISGGGYGQGQLSHLLGLVIWLTGLKAEAVFARTSNIGAAVDVYDALSVRFGNGVIGTVSGAGTAPEGARFQLDIRIYGSKGMLLYDIERERLEIHTHDGKHELLPVAPDDGAYRCDEPPHQFVELILGLTDANNAPGTVALGAVEILDAAYRSAQSGRDEAV